MALSVNLDQWADGPAPDADGTGGNNEGFINGNLNPTKAHYNEGDSVPYRAVMDDLQTGHTYSIRIQWDTVDSGAYAIDYLTGFNFSFEGTKHPGEPDVTPTVGINDLSIDPDVINNPDNISTIAIPSDPRLLTGFGAEFGVTDGLASGQPSGVQEITIFGAVTNLSTSEIVYSPDGTKANILVTFTYTGSSANNADSVVIAWGGHIASSADWSDDTGETVQTASDISGSPYHTRVLNLVDNLEVKSVGNQDRSLSADAVEAAPSLTIVKELTNANDAVVDTAGETIEYTITVDNTGNVDLTNVVLTDTFAGGASLVSGDTNTNNILETTETWVYSADYTVTQADLNAGANLVNVAVVDTNQTDPQSDDATSTVDQNPSLTIVKDLTNANDAVVDTAGETIEYTITVDNTGNVDLTNVVLTDTFAGGASLVSGDTNTNNILETTETWVYSADYTVTQADLNAGANLVNVAVVDTNQTDPQSDDATSTVDQNPSLTIVKDLTNADDAVVDTAGETIEYTITVDNTGNVDLTNVVLTDTFAGGASLVSGDTNTNNILETTETWVYSADYTVTQADLNAGANLVNVAVVDTNQTDPQSDDATSTVDQNPSLTIVKDLTNANDAVVDTAGETIEYTITVDNTGNVDLTNVVLTDTFAGGASLVSGDTNTNNILETTETWVYSADYTVTQADLNAGANLVNVAVVDTNQTDPQSDDATSTVDQNPSLTIVKDLTNADDAVVDTAGETIEYTITVDNTGNVDLTNVVLTDTFAGGASLVSGDTNTNNILETTETWVYSADYTVTQADLNAGADLVNVAVVDTNQTDPQSDDATSTVDQNPSLTIVKDLTNADDAVVDTAGETIEYTITVDNTGSVDLTNVVLTDTFAGGASLVSGDTNTNNILETTETWVYSADYTVTQADLNAGANLVNVAVVDTNQTDPQSDDATSTVDQNPSLTIVKDLTNANDAVVDTAGETIEYTITVDNTGNVDLTNVVLTDTFAGGASLVSGDTNTNNILETTETWVYSADYTVTQADLNAGANLVNVAVVDTNQTDPQSDDATSTVDQNPSLTIVKDLTNANDAVVDTAGETIEYTITVDNTGNVDLTNVVLTDTFAGGASLVSGDTNTNNILETTETWVYSADYTVTQADLNAGANLVNVAVVDTNQTDPQSDDATSTVDQNPSLTIVKDLTNANDAVVDTAGETIEYTITVDNTGNVDLTNVVLTDTFAGGASLVSGDTNTNNILETTETWVYSADYTVTQADLNAGANLVNVAVVDTNQTDPQSDDATSTVDQNPSLTIVKDLTNANDAVVDTAGETIEYTITVDNTGNVDLTNVVLTDTFAGGASLVSGDTNNNNILETTETWVYSADYTVTQADLNAGANLVNVAVVDTNQTDPQSDDATSTVDQNPSLTIVKDLTNANDAVVDTAGETIEYTITVDNTGNVDLTNVVLTDTFAGGASLVSGDTNNNNILETTETWVYSADYTVTQADLNAGANLVNVAVVDTNQTDPQSDDATSTVDQNPSLTIVKDVDQTLVFAPGVLTYTITVDNTGNVDLTNVVLTDTFAGGASLVSGDTNTNNIFETTETWVYSADYTVTQADINAGDDLVNVAVVDTNQTDPQSDDATTTVLAPPVVIAGSPQFNFPNDVSKIQPKLQGGEFTLNPGGYVYWDFYTLDTSKAAIGLNSGTSGYGFDIDIVTVWSSGTQAVYRVYVANETSNPISLAENTDIVNYSISGTDKGFLDLVNADPIIGNFNNFNNIENAVTKASDGFDTPPITPTINADKIWSSSNLTGQPPNNFGESPPNPGIDSLAGNDLFYGVNNSATNAFGATNGTETMQGSAGDDLIDGRSGDDNISGGEGNDYLFGGTGNDTLNGGNGNDTLIGSYGGNQLTGGDGSDVFILQIGGIDLVQDFVSGQDQLWISTFNGGSNPTTAQFHDGSLATAAAGTKVIYDQTTGSVYFDQDGLSTAGVKDDDTFLVAVLGTQTHPDINAADILI